MIYPYKMTAGSFERMNEVQIKGEFGDLMGQSVLITVCMVLVAVLYFGIVNMGLEKGDEGITKIMKVMLVLLLVILAVHSILLPGVAKGRVFYLLPDFGKMKEAGLLQVISASMNQSFFTLSLGTVEM